MIIPHEQINPDTLTALIEEFVTREGTDYGESDTQLSTKVAQVLAQLKSGSVVIVYDSETQSCNLLPSDDKYSVSLSADNGLLK